VKQGGNVVAYFCTPDLEILHAVWGPESPDRFLEQARFAVDLAEKLRNASAAKRSVIAREAHEENPYGRSKGLWNQAGGEHYVRYSHLKEKVLQPLTKATAEELFLKLVNEKSSDEKIREVNWFEGPTPSSRRRP
jgi:hypothetical protein